MSEETRWDRAAELSLIAAGMESRTARDAARSIVYPGDFYDPRHQDLWEAMSSLDRHGKKVDPITVSAALGSSPASGLLLDLVTTVGLPDMIGEYAAIVRGWSVRRQIDLAAMQARQDVYNPDTPAATIASQVASRFIGIRDGGQATDDMTALTARELLEQEDDEPEWLIPSLLERRDRLILTGEEGLGKALAVDTPIPTPKGWTTMGDLTPGDEVFSADGQPVRIVAATDTMHGRPCYRVSFSDGSHIVADEQHLWLTRDYKARQPRAFNERAGNVKPRGTDQRRKRTGYEPAVRTTRELRQTLRARGGHTLNHSIDTTLPLAYPAQEQLIDPYVLGAWLGDGSSTASYITTHPDDHEILDRIRESWSVRATKRPFMWAIGDGAGRGKRGTSTFLGCLRHLGVYGDKHIPEEYLHGSTQQRLALLQGLMDTDGTIGTGASPIAEFSVTSERLARDVHELLLGLGVKVRWAEGPARLNGRVVGARYRLAFQTHLPVFHLRRKASRQVTPRTDRYRRRYVTAVEPVDSVPVRCIQVERSDGMFLAGRECIPTHNSHMLRQIAVHLASGLDPFHTAGRYEPGKALIVDCENSWPQVRRKLRPAMEWVGHRSKVDPLDRLVVDCLDRIDITRDRDLARIHRLVDAVNPDLVVIGPLYRLTPRALQTDDEAVPVLAALDTIRERGCALLMEAHAGHAIGKGGVRDLRPRGSSALLGWPEFGYGMRAVATGYADLIPWRGNREEREWPQRLVRSDGFRWMPHTGQYEPVPA